MIPWLWLLPCPACVLDTSGDTDPGSSTTTEANPDPIADDSAADEGAASTTPHDTGTPPADTTDAHGSSSDDDGSTTDATDATTTGDTGATPIDGCSGATLVDEPPAICSLLGEAAVLLTVQNTCGFDLELFWVGYDCVEVSYQVVAAGTVGINESFVSHPWRLRDAATGALVAEIPALDGDATFMVE